MLNKAAYIFELNRNGKFTDINYALSDILYKRKNEVLEKFGFNDITYPDVHQKKSEAIFEILEFPPGMAIVEKWSTTKSNLSG